MTRVLPRAHREQQALVCLEPRHRLTDHDLRVTGGLDDRPQHPGFPHWLLLIMRILRSDIRLARYLYRTAAGLPMTHRPQARVTRCHSERGSVSPKPHGAQALSIRRRTCEHGLACNPGLLPGDRAAV